MIKINTNRYTCAINYGYLLILAVFLTANLPAIAQEICNNGVDDDGDGQIDCYDAECANQAACDSFFYGYPINHCQIQPPVGPFGVTLVWESIVDVSARSLAVVGDIDGDNIPEVIVHKNGANQLYVLDGLTGATEVTINCPAINDLSNAIAVADVDLDGYGEIYAVSGNAYLHCFEHNGTPKAGFNSIDVGNFEVGPGIADFNGDGVPEVYIGNKIYNSLTGALICQGNGSTGKNGQAWHPAVADLLPSNACADCAGLEMACGNTVYSVNIATGTMTALPNNLSGLGDGYTSIADMNQDGNLDVVVTSAGKVYVWNPVTGNQMGGTYTLPGTGTGGRPNIADYDNDGKPEIGVVGKDKYVMLDFNTVTNQMSQVWLKNTIDGSQMTTGSAFDFEGDGATEVVYRDENNLFVYDGATGAVKLSTPCGSATRTEFPTVADVNGDGKANIICNCSTANQGGTGKVRVYESSGFDWIGSRDIMNQHSYSVTNVNEDLTIPIQQQNNAVFPEMNTFISQAPYFDENWDPIYIPVADLTVNFDTIVFCEVPNQFSVTLTVCNHGSKRVNGTIPITFYTGDPLAGGTVFQVANMTATNIDTGDCVTETFDLPWNDVPFNLYAAINDDGSSPPNAPELVYKECDSTNNIHNIYAPGVSYDPIIAGLEPLYCPEDSSFALTGTPVGGVFSGPGITGSDFNPAEAGFGQHVITYTFSFGVCDFDTTESVTVVNALIVNAGNDTSVCSGQPANLGAPAMTGYNYTWSSSIGLSSSNISDPTLTLTNSGSTSNVEVYTLTADSSGCVNSDDVQVTVHPNPVAEFDYVHECHGTINSFTDQSDAVVGTIDQYMWNFGDNNMDNQADPTNLYDLPGLYNVKLVVETSNGCQDSIEHQVEVYNRPVSDFSVDNVCRDVAAEFVDQSQSLSGNIETWDWDFGDSETEQVTSSAPLQHDYDADGSYTVELIIETEYACKDTFVDTVIIFPVPTTDFTFDSVCYGVPTSFTDLSDASPGNINQWNWDFGGVGSSNDQHPQFEFPDPGNFAVILSVETDSGCPGAIEYPITVYVLPEPDFSSTSVCFGELTEFTDLSTITNGNISAYSWDFDDQNMSSQPSPSHTYAMADFYDVTLTLTSNKNCVDSISHEVEVFPLPEVSYMVFPDTGCMPLEVEFTDQSTIATGYNLVEWYWDFGDFNTSTDPNATNTYDTAGFYTVQLKVVSAEGCSTIVTNANSIEVFPLPHAGFVPSPQPTNILYPYIDFSNTSVGAIAWDWDFGDGFQSTEMEPSYTYLDTGLYPVEQISTTNHGCADTVVQVIRIDEATTLYVPNAFTPGKDGVNDLFQCEGRGFTGFVMRIYNRWGEMIFFADDISKGWNGTKFNTGMESPEGMYIYKIELIDIEKHPQQFTGQIMLLR